MAVTTPPHPIIHEVNTWVWLDELSRQAGTQLTLADVPAHAWDAVVAPGVDVVWLMGVWQRSPLGRAEALRSPGLQQPHADALSDLHDDDVVGSPYCIRGYTVDPHLGGDAALAEARRQLADRGAKLLVDYVPNHVAHDHAWATDHPEYFVAGTADEAAQRPQEFVALESGVYALGRDPYFAPWTDVLQLNAFNPALREATTTTLAAIAERADGVRCDMAMLLLNEVFARTWGERAGNPPQREFWPDIIAAVRATAPDFLFVAEVYWDLESVLLDQGFDYCYDKRLYDRMVHGSPAALRAHLQAPADYQRRMVRFLENHDEPRSAATLPREALPAAAVAVLTLPGAALLYEGQFQGRRHRPPVALGRRPDEPADADLEQMYQRLLDTLARERLREGAWSQCQVLGWDDNPSGGNLLAWSWQGDGRHLVVINWSAAAAQARVDPGWDDLPDAPLDLTDVVDGRTFRREGAELRTQGLFVDLPAWGFHFLRATAVTTTTAG